MQKGSKKKILKITGLTLLMIMISVLTIGTFNSQLRLGKKEKNEIKAYDGNVTGFTQVVTNINSSLALDTNGKLWGWGSNSTGSLGDGTSGTNNANKFPKIVQEDTSFIKIAANGNTTLAIDTSGNLWVAGINNDGCFGNGTTQDSTTLIKTITGMNFKEISISLVSDSIGVHCLAIDQSNNLWAWGMNTDGQLGNGNTESSKTPIKISNMKFKQAVAGIGYSLAIDENNNLWAWGRNGNGNLGNGNTQSSKTPIKIKPETTFKEIVATASNSFAIDTNGNLWGWGGYGGNNPNYPFFGETGMVLNPKQVITGTKFKKVASDFDSVLAIEENGTLWVWGKNDEGCLGNGTTTTITTPQKIMTGTKFKEASTGGIHSIVIDENGALWGSGYNGAYQLGISISTRDERLESTSVFIPIPECYVALRGEGATTEGDRNVIVAIGQKMPSVATPLKTGYTFNGYYAHELDGGAQYYSNTGASIKSWDIMKDYSVLYAKWTANTNTPYKVEHYQQKAGTTEYTLVKTDNKTGTTDSKVTATATTYTGFSLNTSKGVRSGTVAADGSLVLKLYYDRNEYSVTLNPGDEGSISSGNITKYTYGVGATLPTNVTRRGYTFGGWYTNEACTGTAVTEISATDVGEKTYYAKWIPNTNTQYRVAYYQEEIGRPGEYNWITQDSKILTGTTGASVTAEDKNYPGFTLNTEKSTMTGIVTADGTLLLEVYYDRNTYNVTLNTNGGTIATENELTSYIYGVQTTLPVPTKEGNRFGGWYTTSDFIGTSIPWIEATETGDKTYYAKWVPNQYTVTFVSDGQTVGTQTVNHGSPVTPPVLTKPGYTLTWDKDLSKVTSNMTVTAIWTAGTGTAYKVEYYKQNLTKNGYDKVEADSKTLTGTTGTSVTAEDKAYVGFSLNTTTSVRTGSIVADGSLVLRMYYDRNTYHVILNPGDGTLPEGSENIDYTYGEEKPLPTPEKEGYDFTGWYDEDGNKVEKITPEDVGDKEYTARYEIKTYTVTFVSDGQTVGTQTVNHGNPVTAPVLTKPGYTLTWDKDLSKVTSNMTVTAIWTAGTGTEYKVEYYKQNLAKNGYDKVEEDSKILVGTTGASVTAEEKAYTGFSLNGATSVRTGNIAADGSLVLRMYYDRNTYHVILNPGDGTLPEGSENIDYTYGEEKPLPTPEKEGYDFTGWYDEDGNKVEKITPEDVGDKEYTARYEAKTGTAYKIEYYHQNLAKTGYELAQTETLTGKTGDTVTVVEGKPFRGFSENKTHANRVASGVILGDGTFTLKLYYDRNSYQITLDPGEGTIKPEDEIKDYTFGEEKPLPIPERPGYIFDGWYDEDGNKVDKIKPTDDGNKNYHANWVKEDEYYITSPKYEINKEEKYIMRVSPNVEVTVFLSNIRTNGTPKVLNAKKEEVEQDSLVGTGYILQVDYKGTIYEYEIAVRGDLDGNGKVTVTDLSMLNQALVKRLELTGMRKIAGDIDYNKEVSVTDLSMMNQYFVKKIEL